MAEAWADEFAEMALQLHRGESVDETVELITQAALKAVGAAAASVAFFGKGGAETAAATDPALRAFDAVAFELGEGPALEARGGRNEILVDDTHSEKRWPTWAERMAQAGIRSVLCVGMSAPERDIGVLTLYDSRPQVFELDDAAVAADLARHAAVALAAARRAENLGIAIDARKLVGQAQGILMERFGLTADQAFSVLLRYSQDKNIKLRDVAAKLIADRSLPD